MGKIFRVIFRAKSYDDSIRFYGEILECPIIQSWDRSLSERGSVFSIGSGEIEVLALPPSLEYTQPQGFEITVEVQDVDRQFEFVRAKNVKIRGDLTNKPWGHRAFSINDPDGIKLIFFTPI